MLPRPLNLSYLIRRELEIAEFGRQCLVDTLTKSISVPLLWVHLDSIALCIDPSYLRNLFYFHWFDGRGKKKSFQWFSIDIWSTRKRAQGQS